MSQPPKSKQYKSKSFERKTAPKSAPKSDRPPPKLSGRPSLHVDLGALKANFEALTELVKKPGKPVTIAACVKADAYGLGMGPVAKALYGLGCRSFFVAHAAEGRLLREIIGTQSSIFVFNGPSEAEMPIFFGSKLKPVINSLYQAQLWAGAIDKHEYQPRTAIHIDTGINRLGFSLEELGQLTADAALVKALDIELVMSHLACADTPEHEMNARQLATFKKAASGLPPVTLSLANSAGIYLGKDFHFNMVRPGAALYGLNVTTKPQKHGPIASVGAPIIQIGEIKKGETAGYRASFKARRDTKTITVAAGYADGIPVAGSNISFATLRGQKLKIIGRVSMDVTILDATDYEGDIAIGDRVSFLGYHTDDQAERMGLLDYEMLTRLGSRFRREYHKGRDR